MGLSWLSKRPGGPIREVYVPPCALTCCYLSPESCVIQMMTPAKMAAAESQSITLRGVEPLRTSSPMQPVARRDTDNTRRSSQCIAVRFS